MSTPISHQEGAARKPVMLLDRTVHRACRHCLAPGTFNTNPLTRDGYNEAQIAEAVASDPKLANVAQFLRDGWSACYVEPGDERDGQSVGPTCPNCAAARPSGEKLKTIKIKGFW